MGVNPASIGIDSDNMRSIKKEEVSTRSSVNKTLDSTAQKITNSFIKSIIKAKTPEQLEKILSGESNENLMNRSRRTISLIYVKAVQLFSRKYEPIKLKSNPREAALQLQELANYISETSGFEKNETREILFELSKRIKAINPRVWGVLIKFFDVSFDSKLGSIMLSKFLNIKNLGSNQKLLDYFIETTNAKPVVPVREGIWFDKLQNIKRYATRGRKKQAENEEKLRKGVDISELYQGEYAMPVTKYLTDIETAMLTLKQGIDNNALQNVSGFLKPIHAKISSELLILKQHIVRFEKQGKKKETDTSLKSEYEDYQAHNALLWVISIILKVFDKNKVNSDDLNRVVEYFQKVGKEIPPIMTTPKSLKDITERSGNILKLLLPVFSQYCEYYAKKI